MALGRGPDDRQPEPGALAVEPLENPLPVCRGNARSLVLDAQPRETVVTCDRDRDGAPAVPAGVLDQVAERALERGTVAADEDRLGVNRDALGGDLPREVVEREILGRGRRGFFSRERKQIVRELGEPLCIRFQVGDQCGGRSRGARDAPRFRAARSGAFAARETHRRETCARRRGRVRARRASCSASSRAAPLRPDAAGPAAGAGHRRCGRSPLPRDRDARAVAARRASGARQQHRRCRRHERGDSVSARSVRTVSTTSAVDAATSTALRRRPPIGERSRVDPKPIAAEVDGRRSSRGRCDRLRARSTAAARVLRARATGTRCDPRRSTTSTIACVDPTGASSAPGCRDERRRRGGELRDLDRAGAQASGRARGADAARRARRRPSRARRPRASSRPPRRESSAGGCSSADHEPDAAHGLDQRRLAQLAAEVRHVAIDGVRAASRRARSVRPPARAIQPAARFAAATRAGRPRAA